MFACQCQSSLAIIDREFSVMAEMSSLSSASVVLKNVTVTPSVFKLKKCYRTCCMPHCTNRHGSIAFGDLVYLQHVCEAGDNGRLWFRRSHRDFSHGNYSISVVSFQDEAKPMIIFHHENFDPSLLARALLDCKGWDKNEGSTVDKCGQAFGAMNCTSSKPSTNHRWVNKRQDGNDDNLAQTLSDLATKLKLVWKLDPTDAERTAGLRTPRLDGLFYFLDAKAWFEHCSFRDTYCNYSDAGEVEISAFTDGIYQLQAINDMIGVAINPTDIFGDAEVSSVKIRDTSHKCLAIVLHGFEEQDYNGFPPLIFPMESFLYENVYRSFYKFGKEIDNPYYGYDEDNEFARLPDTVFVQILSYLPWRQRMQCRRVNKRWQALSNLATAIDTKVIDLSDDRYDGMRTEHLNVVLPMVSNYLEEFIWWDDIYDFEGFGRMQLFPKLRKIEIGEITPDFDGFFSILNKCPNLKELTAPIPRRPSSSNRTTGPYMEVEQLCLINEATLTDPWLIETTDYFPKLVSLCISGYGYLSSSCISAVAEKYSETLTRLEIFVKSDYGNRSSEFVPPPASVIGAITGFGSCPYLEYLSLDGTEFISDPCMAAIGAGCAKLSTLDISGSCTVTNEGLAALSSLPNLKRLDLSNVGCDEDLSFGIAQLGKAGHLKRTCWGRFSSVSGLPKNVRSFLPTVETSRYQRQHCGSYD